MRREAVALARQNGGRVTTDTRESWISLLHHRVESEGNTDALTTFDRTARANLRGPEQITAVELAYQRNKLHVIGCAFEHGH